MEVLLGGAKNGSSVSKYTKLNGKKIDYSKTEKSQVSRSRRESLL
jgi:hypothetical protein